MSLSAYRLLLRQQIAIRVSSRQRSPEIEASTALTKIHIADYCQTINVAALSKRNHALLANRHIMRENEWVLTLRKRHKFTRILLNDIRCYTCICERALLITVLISHDLMIILSVLARKQLPLARTFPCSILGHTIHSQHTNDLWLDLIWPTAIKRTKNYSLQLQFNEINYLA